MPAGFLLWVRKGPTPPPSPCRTRCPAREGPPLGGRPNWNKDPDPGFFLFLVWSRRGVLVGKMPSEPEESARMVRSPPPSPTAPRALPVTSGPEVHWGRAAAPASGSLFSHRCSEGGLWPCERTASLTAKEPEPALGSKSWALRTERGPSDAWDEGGGQGWEQSCCD